MGREICKDCKGKIKGPIGRTTQYCKACRERRLKASRAAANRRWRKKNRAKIAAGYKRWYYERGGKEKRAEAKK